MIIKTEDAFYKVKEVYSLVISEKSKISTVKAWSWLTPWVLPKIEKVKFWQLDMIYLSEDEIKYTTDWTCSTREPIRVLKEEIERQVRAQDHEIVDRAFEDAVNNLGKGNK